MLCLMIIFCPLSFLDVSSFMQIAQSLAQTQFRWSSTWWAENSMNQSTTTRMNTLPYHVAWNWIFEEIDICWSRGRLVSQSDRLFAITLIKIKNQFISDVCLISVEQVEQKRKQILQKLPNPQPDGSYIWCVIYIFWKNFWTF